MFNYRITIFGTNEKDIIASCTADVIRFIYSDADNKGYDFWQHIENGSHQEYWFVKEKENRIYIVEEETELPHMNALELEDYYDYGGNIAYICPTLDATCPYYNNTGVCGVGNAIIECGDFYAIYECVCKCE